MRFSKDISKLKFKDLPRYREFLLDQILGQEAMIIDETIVCRILDKIEEVNKEIRKRNESGKCNIGGCQKSPTG